MSAALVAWEVDNPDGSPLYRGRDIQLAHELCHSAPVGSHLILAAPEVTTLPAPLLSGGEK